MRPAAIAIAVAALAAVVILPRQRLTSTFATATSEAQADTVPLRALGPTASSTVIDFALVLRQHDRALNHYLRELDDPSSANYHHYLSARELGRRFGISTTALRLLRQRLARAGLRVTAAYPQRTELEARGTVAAVGAFFHVSFRNYRDSRGSTYHAPVRQPAVPSDLTRWVVDVAGLSTERRIVPLDVPTHRCGAPVRLLSAPCSGLSPKDIARAYDVAPLHARGLNGQGETVAVVSFARFDDADVATFDQAFALRGPKVEHIKVGTGKVATSGDVIGEVDLDVDIIRAIAPKARILNFEAAGDCCSFARMFNRIVQDGRADVISVSYGLCDDPSDPYVRALRRADLTAMRTARGSGVTIFIASGDAGAYTCQRSKLADHRLSATWPSDSPHAVSVGGTLLSVRQNGMYLEEAGWEYPMTNLGGGGGVNPIDRRPPWQKAPGMPRGGKRVFPHVAAAADLASGFLMVVDGQITPGNGTSQATPFWAGSFALVRQFARRRGAGNVGFLAPILYRIASTRQPFPAFHDVTRGGNRHYDAGPGWDYATGLGSPDVYNLARDVVRSLKSR